MKFRHFLVSLLLLALCPHPAEALLASVSGVPAVNEVAENGNANNVAISLANGFPLWYRDTTGLKLELCLEKQVEKAPKVFFNPCLTAEPIASAPISFPSNFGPEAFYWSATALGTFTSTTGTGDALLVLAQEAAFLNGLPNEGEQVVFGRTRLRVNVPVPGTYRVTYPFGTRDFVVDTVAAGREINQTQDIGILAARDFLASLSNAPVPPAPPAPTPPSIDAGIVNLSGLSIGPFLEGNPLARVFDTNGNQYLADPGTELVPIERPIQAGPEILVDGVPTNVNYFEVTLLDPPGGFNLDATGVDGTVDNTVRISNFQITGKIFNDGPNVAPVATPNRVGTTRGVPIVIDVATDDTDDVTVANVHGRNLQALGIVNGPQILRTTPLTTSRGATVQRTTDLATGRSFFLYTPQNNALAVGEDTFTYVIQDKGGLISAPATVTVTVEDLAVNRAEFRPRTGRWQIGGTTSDVTANTVTLHGGPRTTLSAAPGVTTSAGGTAALRVTGSGIDFRVALATLPASAVTAVRIHVVSPAAGDPFIFTLFDSARQGAFPGTGTLTGTLPPTRLVQRTAAGILTFDDAVNAILAGNAFISVQTAANPNGEIRGSLSRPVIGTAPVRPDGTWSFRGKATVSPGALSNISATSANGVSVLGVPLRLR